MSKIITLAGHLGSGKTSVSKALAAQTGWVRLSVGDIFRAAASERGMELPEFMRTEEANSREFNDHADAAVAHLACTHKTSILDGRVAWHFAPDSFKVMLLVHPREAARRAFNAPRERESYTSEADALLKLRERHQQERTRFKNLYNVDVAAYKNYDLVIDTTRITTEQTVSTIKAMVGRHADGQPFPKFWVSPHNLFCTQLSRDTSPDNVEDKVLDIQANGYDENFPIDIGRIGSFNFIFEGHHRSLASIITKLPLIPARISREHEVVNGYSLTTLDVMKHKFSLTHVYDWEEIVRHMTDDKQYTMWTYPPAKEGKGLDVRAIAAESWDGSWYSEEPEQNPAPTAPQIS